MNRLAILSRLLRHYAVFFAKAETRYGLHAPFLYQLAEEVLEDDRYYYAFAEAEQLRRRLLDDQRMLSITDHGAGSLVDASRQRSISSIARHSAISQRSGQLLFRLVHWLKPKHMLELGTSLGLSAYYQAAADRRSRFITVEGCPQIAEAARKHLSDFGMGQVQVVNATFAEALPEVLEQLGRLDYLYLDGDHRRGASLQYFETCLPYAHADSVFVIADIYWSDEMRKAWKEMQQHPEVTLSVDLFHFGLLFFRKEQREPQHLRVVRSRYKPWRMGFFN